MKLIIGNPVPNTKTPNTFEVIVTTMEGDADGYDDIVVGPFKKDQDEHLIEHLLATLKEMKDEYPHGRGGDDEYTHIEGFLMWFEEEYRTEEYLAEKDLTEGTEEEYPERHESIESFLKKSAETKAFYARNKSYPHWEYEPNSGIANSYESYKILYYDENKVAHKVTVEG